MDPINVPYALKACFSNKCVYIPVSEHFSFAKIILTGVAYQEADLTAWSLHRCGLSRSWLNSMIITQVHLVLRKIKSHSKMFSFVTQHNRCFKLRELLPESWIFISLPASNVVLENFQQASQPQTTCNHASPAPPHQASTPAGSSETSHPDNWWNCGFAQPKNFSTNCHKPSQGSSSVCSSSSPGSWLDCSSAS